MIKLGPAGNCDKDILSSIKRLKEGLGLGAQEVEFTYGVNMSLGLARQAGELARKEGIELSVHAPYYINLLSEEKAKIAASKKRILMAAERGHYLGATFIVFHAGFYGRLGKEEAYEGIKKEILELQKEIKKKKWNAKLAPETTGKLTQFGNLDELLKLSKETRCSLCIDFAHLKARTNGKMTYKEMIEKIKGRGHIHSHFSGIEFTAKGERNHKITPEAEIKELLRELIRAKIDITIINESPVTWKDSLKMKEILKNLK
jgi:deoxyribonuclease-4